MTSGWVWVLFFLLPILWAYVTGKAPASASEPEPPAADEPEPLSESEEPQATAVAASRRTETSRPVSLDPLVARGLG